jgi:DNA-binding GntR family transcriptional regulator
MSFASTAVVVCIDACGAIPMKEQVGLSLGTQILGQLRDAILWGKFAPGERLRLESLQKAFGYSSTPLREALTRLTGEGLAELEDHRGFRVTPVSVEELREITRLRVLFEQEALKESIARGGDDWGASVVAAFHRLAAVEKRMPDLMPALSPEWSDRHREFHAALISACSSPKLLQLCADYFVRAERYRRLSAEYRKTARNKSNEHGRIMRAALSRQTDAALDLIAAHIERTAEAVAPALAAGRR